MDTDPDLLPQINADKRGSENRLPKLPELPKSPELKSKTGQPQRTRRNTEEKMEQPMAQGLINAGGY